MCLNIMQKSQNKNDKKANQIDKKAMKIIVAILKKIKFKCEVMLTVKVKRSKSNYSS